VTLGCNCHDKRLHSSGSCRTASVGAFIARQRAFHGFGFLGASAATGQVVSKVAGTAAGTEAGAAAGAAYGSVIPGIGTAVGAVVGAVVGLLTSKLFGHANYAALLNAVQNQIKLAYAYMQVAGRLPGRNYGVTELKYIGYGLMELGLWPQNGPGPKGCSSNTWGTCGNSAWFDAVFSGTGAKAIPTYIKAANAAGVYNPVDVWNQFIKPGWEGPPECSKCVDWFRASASENPSLVAQWVIDCVDAYEAQANPNLNLYYGQLITQNNAQVAQALANNPVPPPPQGQVTITIYQLPSVTYAPQPPSIPAGSTSTTTIAPSSAPSAPVQPAPPVTPAGALVPQVTNAPQKSPAGATLTAPSGGTLVTAQGTWSFGATPNSSGDYPVLLNGQNIQSGAAIKLLIDANGNLNALNASGYTYQWTGTIWQQTSGPAAGTPAAGTTSAPPKPTVPAQTQPPAPAPTLSVNGTVIPPAPSIVTAQGTWTLSTQTDGVGNSLTLLNGTNTNGGVASQLALINNSIVALHADGSTWGWSGSTWTQLSPATPLSAPAAPVASVPASIYPPPALTSTTYDEGPLAPASLPVYQDPSTMVEGPTPTSELVAGAANDAASSLLSNPLVLILGAAAVGALVMSKRGKKS